MYSFKHTVFRIDMYVQNWYLLLVSWLPVFVKVSGGARALKLGGTISCRRREVSRGVRGHAPPGKFCNRESLKRNFLGFPGNFEVNSQDFEAT